MGSVRLNQIKRRKETIRGFLQVVYTNQKTSSVRRGHVPPEYTFKQLEDYCKSSDLFLRLFNDWVESGNVKDLAPSLDRIDDGLGYSFNNIRVVTWAENNKKYKDSTRIGVLQYSKSGELLCEYNSIHEACKKYSLGTGNLSKVLKGQRKTCGGFVWKYKK